MPATLPAKFAAVVAVPLQTVWLDKLVIEGIGLTVTASVNVTGLAHPFALTV